MPTEIDLADSVAKAIVPRSTSRRTFLKRGAMAAVVAPAAVSALACGSDKAAPATASKVAAPPVTTNPATDSDHSGGSMAANPARVKSDRAAADAMDQMHEAGVKAFPAKTEGKGNQLLAARVENGVKVFDITASVIQWEVEPGRRVEAWAYNGQVPGPQLRVRQGDRVRVIVKNDLPESTAVHFHGVLLQNAMDGVPYITQPPIKPGETFTYDFVAKNSGSHMYHSHHNAARQVGSGLLGAFIVEPKAPRASERADIDYVMILNDGAVGYTLNGKSFPATEPIVARLGQRVRVRFMNEGMMIHPMHLHGMPMTVITKDGYYQPTPWQCDTLNISPGERWDVIVDCDNPGTWAFHCHILPHAESQHGMFGMVTALIVKP